MSASRKLTAILAARPGDGRVRQALSQVTAVNPKLGGGSSFLQFAARYAFESRYSQFDGHDPILSDIKFTQGQELPTALPLRRPQLRQARGGPGESGASYVTGNWRASGASLPMAALGGGTPTASRADPAATATRRQS